MGLPHSILALQNWSNSWLSSSTMQLEMFVSSLTSTQAPFSLFLALQMQQSSPDFSFSTISKSFMLSTELKIWESDFFRLFGCSCGASSSTSELISSSSRRESSVMMEEILGCLAPRSVKAMMRDSRRLSMSGSPSVSRMMRMQRMKQAASTTNLSCVFSMMLMKSSKLPFLMLISIQISRALINTLLSRMTRSRVYTFLMISLDCLFIMIPVILKFMKKNPAMKATTLKQLRADMKALRVSQRMTPTLKMRRGIMRHRKVRIWTPCMRTRTTFSTCWLPKMEKESARQCSKAMRNSSMTAQSANTKEFLSITSMLALSKRLNWSGMPCRIFTCRITQMSILEAMQKMTKRQYLRADERTIILIFLSRTVTRLTRQIWLMTIIRKMSSTVTGSRVELPSTPFTSELIIIILLIWVEVRKSIRSPAGSSPQQFLLLFLTSSPSSDETENVCFRPGEQNGYGLFSCSSRPPQFTTFGFTCGSGRELPLWFIVVFDWVQYGWFPTKYCFDYPPFAQPPLLMGLWAEIPAGFCQPWLQPPWGQPPWGYGC